MRTLIGREPDRPYYSPFPNSALWENVPLETVRQIVPRCSGDGGVAVLRDAHGAFHVIEGDQPSVWRAMNPNAAYGFGLKWPCTPVVNPAELGE